MLRMIFIGGNGGGGLGGGVVQGRGYDPFKTWSCDTSFKRQLQAGVCGEADFA